jgi:hypothetical protein
MFCTPYLQPSIARLLLLHHVNFACCFQFCFAVLMFSKLKAPSTVTISTVIFVLTRVMCSRQMCSRQMCSRHSLTIACRSDIVKVLRQAAPKQAPQRS